MANDGYLIRCHDGPSKGDFVTTELEWPLPDRLVYFPETGVLVPADSVDKDGKQVEWPTDLGLTFYKKTMESQLPDDVDDIKTVMRGAQYWVDTDG